MRGKSLFIQQLNWLTSDRHHRLNQMPHKYIFNTKSLFLHSKHFRTASGVVLTSRDWDRNRGSGSSKATIYAWVASAPSEWLVLVLPLEECLSPLHSLQAFSIAQEQLALKAGCTHQLSLARKTKDMSQLIPLQPFYLALSDRGCITHLKYPFNSYLHHVQILSHWYCCFSHIKAEIWLGTFQSLSTGSLKGF